MTWNPIKEYFENDVIYTINGNKYKLSVADGGEEYLKRTTGVKGLSGPTMNSSVMMKYVDILSVDYSDIILDEIPWKLTLISDNQVAKGGYKGHYYNGSTFYSKDILFGGVIANGNIHDTLPLVDTKTMIPERITDFYIVIYKNKIISIYIQYFSYNKTNLPSIKISDKKPVLIEDVSGDKHVISRNGYDIFSYCSLDYSTSQTHFVEQIVIEKSNTYSILIGIEDKLKSIILNKISDEHDIYMSRRMLDLKPERYIRK